MDITKEFEANKDNWLAEVRLQNLLREAFPEQKFWVELNDKTNEIVIKDCVHQKIIITGSSDNPQVILEADGDSHVLKQAAAYILTKLTVLKNPMGELADLLFGG